MTKDAPAVKTLLQSRPCWRKAQHGPVKPACGITARLQSACYNLPVACPAPAPHSRATQPVFLQAHTSTHHGRCSFWPNREVSEEQSLSITYPGHVPSLFVLHTITGWYGKDSTSLFRIKEAGQ